MLTFVVLTVDLSITGCGWKYACPVSHSWYPVDCDGFGTEVSVCHHPRPGSGGTNACCTRDGTAVTSENTGLPDGGTVTHISVRYPVPTVEGALTGLLHPMTSWSLPEE